jgi:ferredoxin--NADP+ reductase
MVGRIAAAPNRRDAIVTFVITQNCCTDASCVPVCPVDCIRPVPPGNQGPATMLYIDPDTCVDCGACVEVCPVDAIYHEDELPADQGAFRDINANYFAAQPLTILSTTPPALPKPVERGTLRVAVVGAGPAACYAIAELVKTRGVQINVFDQLPTPFGLIRFGVAPDHQRTKRVAASFESALAHPDVRCYFNIEVGRDITFDELRAHHHAVIFAVGASRSRDLGIRGEELPGNHAASDLVGWYNGHPDHCDDHFDLTGPRAVIVGNGNVALDVARILLMDRDDLAATDVAEHALARLRTAHIEEVVVLGRRDAGDAALSVGELTALGNLTGVDVVVEGDLGERPRDEFDGALKYDIIKAYAALPATPGHRRLVLRFSTAPVEFVGDQTVEGIRVADGSAISTINTTLVLRSIGYKGSAIKGLPFDEARGVVPNDRGRVVYDDVVEPGVYVTGWIKRGPRGVIGTNRTCAQETLAAVLDDLHGAKLPHEPMSRGAVDAILSQRNADPIDWAGWKRIDDAERAAGHEVSRPRVKLVAVSALVEAAQP